MVINGMIRIALLFLLGFVVSSPVDASTVTVKKSSAGWMLKVDGKPFFIKGIGCNTAEGPNGEDYLLMAKDMGANAVRTWGITPRSYFDKAHKYGLKVNAGIWFDPAQGGLSDSYTDPVHRRRLKEETLKHVREMKDHPALLMWNIGNEVFAFTESEEEKKAFGAFLEGLIKEVHRIDPRHPVVYASSGRMDLPYLERHAPSLDIIGLNAYGTYRYILRWLDDNKVNKPVVLTEYGPYGEWDRQKDANGQAHDPYDQNKAQNLHDLWREIEHTKDRALGGFAFVLGDPRNQASATWYNVNVGDKKRQAYWTLYKLYTGRDPKNRPPKIRVFKVNKTSGLLPDETITLETTSTDPDGDRQRFSYFITDIVADPLVVQPPRYYPPRAEVLSDGRATVRAPGEAGVYRVYVFVEDGRGNIAVANRSIEVSAK